MDLVLHLYSKALCYVLDIPVGEHLLPRSGKACNDALSAELSENVLLHHADRERLELCRCFVGFYDILVALCRLVLSRASDTSTSFKPGLVLNWSPEQVGILLTGLETSLSAAHPAAGNISVHH